MSQLVLLEKRGPFHIAPKMGSAEAIDLKKNSNEASLETVILAIARFSDTIALCPSGRTGPPLQSSSPIPTQKGLLPTSPSVASAVQLPLMERGEHGEHTARQAHIPPEYLTLERATPSPATQKLFSHVSQH